MNQKTYGLIAIILGATALIATQLDWVVVDAIRQEWSGTSRYRVYSVGFEETKLILANLLYVLPFASLATGIFLSTTGSSRIVPHLRPWSIAAGSIGLLLTLYASLHLRKDYGTTASLYIGPYLGTISYAGLILISCITRAPLGDSTRDDPR